MPQRPKNNDHHTRWHNFHFSGKVIICSVLLGLGLVLVGGLVFAIGINDDDDDKNKLPQRYEDEMPTKAPSSIVGPTIMGIGGFIVVTGVVMCLFETEVCRKRSADASPLIGQRTDPEAKGSDPVTVPEPKSHEKHHHRSHKKSPTRISKGNKKYNSSKDNSLSPSSKIPSTSAGASKQFLSSSDSSFQTPPASFKNILAMQSNAREDNQTSDSLLKSFTSSGKSWTTSAEFQTPATSFKDTSSLETSIQSDDSSTTLNNPVMGIGPMINAGFLTPVTPSEDVVSRISSGIQKQKLEESNNSSTSDSQVLEHFSQDKIKETEESSSIHNNDCEKVGEHEFQNNEKEVSICAGDDDASLQLQHEASQSKPIGNNKKNEIKIETEKNESVLTVSDYNQTGDISLSSELKRSVQKIEENGKLLNGKDDGKSSQLLPPSNGNKNVNFVHDNVTKEKTDKDNNEVIDDDDKVNYISPTEEKNINLNDKVKPLSDETINDGSTLQPPQATNLENLAETESFPSDQMVNSTLQNEDVLHEIESDLKMNEEAEKEIS